jgi:hypothetical protein
MLSQAELKQYVDYDPSSGVFTRLRSAGGHPVGEIMGGPDLYGYILIGIKGKRYKAHRLAFLYMSGSFPTGDVDHINRNPADNRWANLREATRQQNVANGGARRNNKCGLRGVCYSAKGWKAQIKVNGRNSHIGYFKTALAAHDAYLVAAKTHFGDFAAAV